MSNSVAGLRLDYVFVVFLSFFLRPTDVFIQIEKSCAQIVAMVGLLTSARLLKLDWGESARG